MKKLIFANCILAIAVIFSFCAKPDLKQELSTVAPNTKASSRDECKVKIFPNALTPLTYCGTDTNLQDCGFSPCAVTLPGVEVVTGDADLFFGKTPVTFSISSDFGNSVILETSANQIGPINIPAGECVSFTVDFDCTIHL